jgi:flagellar hook-associated protein 2
VDVAFNSDTEQFVFTSRSYGSSSNVSFDSADFGADIAELGFTDLSDTGVDVAGTIGGFAATGEGQILRVDDGDAAGLQVRILGDQIGRRGDLTFVEGIAERTVNLISGFVGADGAIESRTEGLNRDLERIQEDRVKLEDRIASYRERLVRQFTAADSLISQLNSTRDYVSQQLAALAPQNNRDN